MENNACDPIPYESWFEFCPAAAKQAHTCRFLAFNTVVTFQAFGQEAHVKTTFEQALRHCRRYERLFSRTLEHSDISRLSRASGQRVPLDRESFRLLESAQYYCEESGGVFDISIGCVSELWDFHEGVIPCPSQLQQRLEHVNWRALRLTRTKDGYFAQLDDAQMRLDVGGIAKGYIADELGKLFLQAGLDRFVINLGGNVLVRGRKPDGSHWRVGIDNPAADAGTASILHAFELEDASVVTSGIGQRSFTHEGRFYHHILDPRTGMPVQTDLASASVIARTSIDAEGFSTTLLALGLERARAFAQAHPAIQHVIYVDRDNKVYKE